MMPLIFIDIIFELSLIPSPHEERDDCDAVAIRVSYSKNRNKNYFENR